MKIEWNKVTKLSQIVAIALFICVFYWGFYLGRQVALSKVLGREVNSVVFQCDDNKPIKAVFYKNSVRVNLDKKEEVFLPQTISASGARYANDNESIIFWNKGDTAFVEEGGVTTFTNCVISSSTQTSTQVR
jgi:membrane-bound inhibitor of C-type lysozyme